MRTRATEAELAGRQARAVEKQAEEEERKTSPLLAC